MIDKVLSYISVEALFKDPPILQNHVHAMPQVDVEAPTLDPNHLHPQPSEPAAPPFEHAKRIICAVCGGRGVAVAYEFDEVPCSACGGLGLYNPMSEVP